ncbi:hypothetical protein B0H13DRAFT_1908866 [Mycena leptocephala]|nr:hypothetical protein B0H13DRAFT_1908866 [Mycena leptocephala]
MPCLYSLKALLHTHTVSHSSTPRSDLSAGFHARLPVQLGTPQLLITTATGVHHPISLLLAFTVSAHASSDVELGLDWTALLRDSLIGLGYRVDSAFDAWRFLTTPTHPVTTASSVEQMPQYSQSGTVPPIVGYIGEASHVPGLTSGNASSVNSENNYETLNYRFTSSIPRVSTFKPHTPRQSSSTLQPSHAPANAIPSDDILTALLLFPVPSQNIFTAEPSELVKIVKSHHITITPTLTVRGAFWVGFLLNNSPS